MGIIEPPMCARCEINAARIFIRNRLVCFDCMEKEKNEQMWTTENLIIEEAAKIIKKRKHDNLPKMPAED